MKFYTKLSFILFTSLATIGSCSNLEQPEPSGIIPPTTTSFTGVIQDDFEGEGIAIYANAKFQIFVAYSRVAKSGKTLDLHLSPNPFPFIFEDEEGTQWDIFGTAISGPGKGDALIPVPHQVGYWFSFSSFFPKVTLYGEAENERLFARFNGNEWLINPDDIKQGASQDGIPSINEPEFSFVDLFDEQNDPYEENELMVVILDGSSIKAYPHAILNWHEIVNDSINGENIALSYCPLTGTSSIWNSEVVSGQALDFGVSGLLYNNNLILYDRNTESLWSQILNKSINGSLKDTTPKRENSVEMNWRGVKQLHQPTLLLSENTGFSRRYDLYPYGDYRTSSNFLFNLTYSDERLHPKERVLAVMLNDKAKIYQLEDFSN